MEGPALINWLKIALYLNAMAGEDRMQRAAGDVGYRLLVTVESRRSAAVITLIYCFIAVRRLLAVDGFQLAACAPLMQIKEGKKKPRHHIPHLHRSGVAELIWELQS